MRENQQKQVQDRIATFEEGRRLKEEAQKRRERIEDIKKKKIAELRCSSPAPLPVPRDGMAGELGLGTEGALWRHSGMLPSEGGSSGKSGPGFSWLSENCLAGGWSFDRSMFGE